MRADNLERSRQNLNTGPDWQPESSHNADQVRDARGYACRGKEGL